MANSALQTIFQCDFNNATDAISNKRIYASTITNVFPDGASVDSKYNLWSANWGGTSLSCYAVNGAERVFEMPVSHPTWITFGGDNNDLMFVTTANCELSAAQKAEQPLAGSLLIFRSEAIGLDSHIFSTATQMNSILLDTNSVYCIQMIRLSNNDICDY